MDQLSEAAPGGDHLDLGRPPPPLRPAPPAPRRRPPALLRVLAILAAAVIAGIGLSYTLADRSGPSPGPGAPSPPAPTSAVAQGLVDVDVTLGHQGGRAAGTGMVLTPTGEVLTNNHVIEGATGITATAVATGTTYTGSVVGYSVTDDIAVVQLQRAGGLATVPLGNSTTVRVGDPVTALGNAGGVGGRPATVSGTVTALDQAISAADQISGTTEALTGLIETDAAIQAGDSGGPLVDVSGEVVGMNTAASSGFVLGSPKTQGFAIPINTARTIAGEITAGVPARAVHVGPTAFLGVTVVAPAGSALAPGPLVVDVLPGGPGAKAGLRSGDTITAVGGTPVADPPGLSAALLDLAPGQRVRVDWVDATGAAHRATGVLASGPPQ